METRDFQAPDKPKLLNQSKWNFARLTTSASYLMCKKWLESLGWGGPTDRWNITWEAFLTTPYLSLPYLYFILVRLYTAQTAQPICTHDISNDAVCSKKVPYGGRVYMKQNFGVKTPEYPKFWNPNAKFPAKSILRINFWTMKDRRKIPTDHLHKIGVAESKHEAISALGRHLTAKTISGLISQVSKSRITCMWKVTDERKTSI
jgi:hypothetical protein